MFFIHSLYSLWRTSAFAHVNCNLLQSLNRVQQYMWQSCEVVHTNICRYSECWQGPWEESGAAEGDACRCSETCNSTKKNPNWIQPMASGLTLEFLKLPINVNECTCTCSVPHDLKWDKQLKKWLKVTERLLILKTKNWYCSYHVCSVRHFSVRSVSEELYIFPLFFFSKSENNYCHATAHKLLPQHGKDWVKMTLPGKWHHLLKCLRPYLPTLGFERKGDFQAYEKMVSPQHSEHSGRKG